MGGWRARARAREPGYEASSMSATIATPSQYRSSS